MSTLRISDSLSLRVSDQGWATRLVASWAKHKAAELRRWERKVRKAYREGTPLGAACGAYADALLECAAVMDRCHASLLPGGTP